MEQSEPTYFDRNERGLEHYRNLKSDLAQNPQRLTTSLPLFVRAILTDGGGHTRWQEFNRYDLINPVRVSTRFSSFRPINPSIQIAERVDAEQADVAFIEPDAFRGKSVLRMAEELFTVQDFIDAIAYNGGLHNRPEENRLNLLYDLFILRHQRVADDLLRSISRCFVEAYEPVYEHFIGPAFHLFCGINGCQPQIYQSGQVFKNGARFARSWLQGPIIARNRHGLRVSIQIQLLEPSVRGTKYLFSVGTRRPNSMLLECVQAGDRLIARVKPHGAGSYAVTTVRTGVHGHMTRRPFILEVVAYPTGELCIATDGDLAADSKGPAYEVTDGKFMLGSDLSGKNGGTFHEQSCVLEYIASSGTTSRLSCTSSSFRLPDWQPLLLPPALKKRPNLLLLVPNSLPD